MLCGQRRAQGQIKRLAKGDTVVHQRLELRFVTAVVAQITLPGQFHNLLRDQPLLVVAVPQPFVRLLVIAQHGLLHVIGRQPFFVVGEARIRLHQVLAVTARLHPKQVILWQG